MAKSSTSDSKPRLNGLTPVSTLPGIGPKRSSILSRAGILTVEDMLFYFPYKYEDRRQAVPIGDLRPGMQALVTGRVVQAHLKQLRKRGASLLQASIEDESGRLKLTWFNQHWLADKVNSGEEITLFGTVEQQKNLHVFSMNSPQLITGKAREERGIVPVYQRIKDINSFVFRKTLQRVFGDFELELGLELPDSIRSRYALMPTADALQYLHQPPQECTIEALLNRSSAAHKSLIYTEFFAVQAGLALMQKHRPQQSSGIAFRTSDTIRNTLRSMLPFHLTDGQRQAFKEIVGDMTSPEPMRRLLQGDVGSGKTIVALLAAGLAIENGYQAVFMAPTQILAEQHIYSIGEHCSHTDFKPAFLTGALASGEQRRTREQIASGEANLIVGTNALIQEGVRFKNLGLAIIDEQHRFGVLQRAALLEASAEHSPDLLIMTATPIPRSLTLTLFGDLSTSQITDKPPGRKPVITAVRRPDDMPRIARFIANELAAGRQIYWVCSRIEDNPEDDLRSAEMVYEEVTSQFGAERVGLLHGRMNAAEQDRIMARFVAGDLGILVATTVIEVGVNVPNASVMLIENAERFGLSQLHQLRGRVGRGAEKSYCILMHQTSGNEGSQERLQIMVSTEDGFKIAEKDLELRGPGDFFGTQQSGVPTFRVGNLIRDARALEQARSDAFDYISNPPKGVEKERSAFIDHLRHQWQRRYGLMLVG